MKLRSKNLNWLAGRPVVILGNETAKKLNVHVDERIAIRYKSKKIYAVVDIFPDLVKVGEIGLSNEIGAMLQNKSGEEMDIGTAEMFAGARIVRKKMAGETLSKDEIRLLVSEISNNNLTEAEIAYFVAAEKIRGLSHREIIELTEAMIKTGKKLDFGNKIVADKHCLPFDTPVVIKENNKIFFSEIGDLVEKNIMNKKKDIKVLSWDDKYKVGFVSIEDYFKVKSPKNLRKITLRGNRAISLTEDHSIFILRDGGVLNLPSKDIQKGDYVLVPRGMNHKIESKEIKLIFSKLLKKNKEISKEIQMSNELMRFLGYYVSGGSKNYQGVFLNFGSHEKELIEDARKCIKKVFGVEPTTTFPHKTAIRLCIYSQELSKVFSIFGCGECALDKTIPDFMYSLGRELQLEFLKALFDGDGYTRRGHEAVYVTVSKNLASQLCYLLSFLGISTSTSICKEGVRDFPTGEHSCSKAYYVYTQAREICGGRERTNVSFLNLLPIKEIGEVDKLQIGWVKRKALKNQKYITFGKLNELREVIKSETIRKLIDSDLAVLEVKNNEIISASSEFVYDIKTENGRFIAGFAPICIHNCIGGIAGNRTTPIVVAICAAAGLTMPKSSSRAITSAAGTADTIETIANVELSLEEIKEVVKKTNACLVWGGSLGLAPSDDKIIHIERVLNLDVEPQLLASILSKKIAAGSNRILIDIPYGSGKMQTKTQAKALGRKFKSIAKHFHVKVKPIYTLGIEPIGNGIGPVLEMKDVLSVLKNDVDCPKDLKEKSILLAAKLMSICGMYFTKSRARRILESGLAYRKFREIINTQNKSNDFDKVVSKLRLAKYQKIIYAEKTGKIIEIHNSKINSICRVLGTPETASAGIYLHRHLGSVERGQKLMTIYSESEQRLDDALKFIKEFQPIKIKA
jgi:putative thymidine phosphorylase